MSSEYKFIDDPFKIGDVQFLQNKLYECQRALKWAQHGEQLYVNWTHRLLKDGYEGAEKVRERLVKTSE